MAVAFEVDRRSDIASLPSTRLAAFMDLAGETFKPSTACRLLQIQDEGGLYQLLTTDYVLSQEQLDVVNGLYAVAAAAWHESNGNWREARARLTKRVPGLIKDPRNPSCPERSILETIADGDLEQVLSVMNYQVGDFNPDVIAKDS